jgi:hypothetical protein
MNIKPSLYHIIEDFKHNAYLYGNNPPLKPTITTVRKVMPGAPGRISFTISQTTKQKPTPNPVLKPATKPVPKLATKQAIKYNPADWPEEEDLPIAPSKPSSLQKIYKK